MTPTPSVRPARHLSAPLLTWGVSLLVAGCSSAAPPGPSADPVDPSAASEAFLRTALYDFAADSMEGRAAGAAGHQRATEYLARRARSLGLEPAGENGTYFQDVPVVSQTAVVDITMADGTSLRLAEDVLPVPPLEGLANVAEGVVGGVEVVYGGQMLGADEITAEQARDKVVLLAAGRQGGTPVFGVAPQVVEKFAGAAAVLIASLDYAPPGTVAALSASGMQLAEEPTAADGPLLAFVTTRVASLVMGGSLDEMEPGAVGTPLDGTFGYRDEAPAVPTRNVVAVLPGSDPDLRDEYVVVSAHSDHLAPGAAVPSHDSLRAYLKVVRPRGAEDPERDATAEEQARIDQILEDTGHEVPRADSVFNGADDDGSGSVGLLQIARTLGSDPPRRSVLFVWHTAEEAGLLGAQYFTDNPTVPLSSMVAGLNSDMIGRGGPDDMEGGGPGYLQLIGSRRLSTELGDLVETVNTAESLGFTFDYTFDADGHPDNFYCRSDHYMYARYGIPIVFFSTGGHQDYHQLTDEPAYIDYGKLRRVADLVGSVARAVADQDHRVVVDGPVPDPEAPCQQ